MNYLLRISALALLFSMGAAHSGTPGVICSALDVLVPCEITGWDFAAQALNLRAEYSNSQIFSSFTFPTVAELYDLPLESNWGFKVEGSHHFGMGNDITVSWYHYSKESNFKVNRTIQGIPVVLDIELEPKWDAVNAEFGQLVELGRRENIRFHAGAQFARISTDYYQTVTGFLITDRLQMKFNGFGPRLGADYEYGWQNGFKLYANGAAAILAGDSQFNTATTGIINLPAATARGIKTALVPEIEGKLGTRLKYVIAQGDLFFDAGYLWQNYFGVQTAIVAGTGNGMDFSLHGPYLGVKYMGYV